MLLGPLCCVDGIQSKWGIDVGNLTVKCFHQGFNSGAALGLRLSADGLTSSSLSVSQDFPSAAYPCLPPTPT